MRLRRGIAPRVFALLAAVALVAPSLASLSGPGGLAWLPEHGHLFLSGDAARHPHTHPWDQAWGQPGQQDAVVTRFGATSVPAGTDGTAAVIFTTGELGATDSASGVALPAFAPTAAIAWLTHSVEVAPLVLHGLVTPPLDPPPQQA